MLLIPPPEKLWRSTNKRFKLLCKISSRKVFKGWCKMGSKFETSLASWKQKPLSEESSPRRSSLPAAGALVFGVPVLLLTLDGAVRRVPATVVHGLLLAVVAPLLLLGLRNQLLVLCG